MARLLGTLVLAILVVAFVWILKGQDTAEAMLAACLDAVSTFVTWAAGLLVHWAQEVGS